MLLSLFLAVFVSPLAASGQAPGVLHIKVSVVDADRKVTPVPRHALLISDNPASAPPRRIVTALDGTAEVRLPPGNYTVESDQPVVFGGRAYQWTQTLDIVSGKDAVLELTADNADPADLANPGNPENPVNPVNPVNPANPANPGNLLESDPSFLLNEWQDSVVALWTPTRRASGFLIDARGLIATNQRVIGTASSVEVQLSPAIKVAARVLAADPARDVAILSIDPGVTASVRPVPLGCKERALPPVVSGQELFTIGAPLREPKDMTSGDVSRVEARAITAYFRLASGATGGPVFTAGGRVVGITSLAESDERESRGDASRIVRIDDVCTVVASAEKRIRDGSPPDGTHLPLEPVRPFPVNALEDAAKRGVGSLGPYQLSSSDFDVVFITPILIHAARYPSAQLRALFDFGNWSEYVADSPPVMLLRVTPKLVEGFLTTVARGAARTQGVDLPPIKHAKSSFSRMRVFCGDAEVTPIHPFIVEQRVSQSDVIEEGLYVFDPGALGPHCAAVKLVLYSEKDPAKGDTRVVDPKVIQQVWQDFAPYRQP